MATLKTKYIISVVGIVVGFAFFIEAYSIDMPKYESLEKISIVLKSTELIASGRTYPKFKIVGKNRCDNCYFIATVRNRLNMNTHAFQKRVQ